MPRLTPPLGSKGLYVLRAPWSVPADVIYVCQALRKLKDIFDLGEDPFALYYQPLGLLEADMLADMAAGAYIVTLSVDALDPTQVALNLSNVYVPDTYIEKYPEQNFVPYSHLVLSLSLGLLPDGLDLSSLKAQVANVCSDTIGVVPMVNEHVVPSSGGVTVTQHQAMETARLGLITIRDTDYARLQYQIANNVLLQAQIQTLIQILDDNGLWPPPP